MDRDWKLTEKEFKILKLLTLGYSNPEIAKRLYISTHTVKAHISAIYYKTGYSSRVTLAVAAIKYNIVDVKY